MLRCPVTAHECRSGYILTGDDETGRFYLLHVIVDVSVLNRRSAQERAVNTGISSSKLQRVSSTKTTALQNNEKITLFFGYFYTGTNHTSYMELSPN